MPVDRSGTAGKTDVGYQNEFWIMAPSGTVPTSVDPQEHECENAMKFNIPLTPDATLKIEPSIAVARNSNPVTLPNGPSNEVNWHGNSPETDEDVADAKRTKWKIGEHEDEVDLAVRVKSMKKRTVKVAVWPVSRLGMPPRFSNQTASDQFKSVLKQKLNAVFAYQLNAWFEVELKGNQTTDYLDGNYSGTPYTIRHSPKEKGMINEFRDSTADINLYLIGNVSYYSNNPASSTPTSLAGSSYPSLFAGSGTFANCAVVNMSALYADHFHTAAHEVGHLLIGPGHPDQFALGDTEGGGPAPLQSLPDAEHQKRLMYSKISSTGSLLIKGEWDRAEEWLSGNVDID